MRFLVCLLICMTIATHASPGSAYDLCFQQAGSEYGVAPDLLRAISSHENPRQDLTAINRNANGTYDIGLMQINSLWSRKLGTETWARITEPCVNIRVGAWILAQCVRDFGYGWDAVGCYHSRTPSRRDWYARKIFSKIYSPHQARQSKTAAIGDIASLSASLSTQETGNGLAITFQ